MDDIVIVIDNEKHSLYRLLISARTAGNKNAGQDRAILIRPLLNLFVGKDCDWSDYQCARCYENLLKKYIETDHLKLVLAAAGYDEKYSLLSDATKRRRSYSDDHCAEDPKLNTDNKALEIRENKAIRKMSIALTADYKNQPLKLYKTLLSEFSHEELVDLGLDNLLISEAACSGTSNDNNLSEPMKPANKKAAGKKKLVGIVIGVAALLILFVVVVVSSKPSPGRYSGGDPEGLPREWDIIESEDYFLSYGILSSAAQLNAWNPDYDYGRDLISHAKEGQEDDQFRLGSAYLLMCDYEQGAKWIELAAEQNHASAQAILSVLYLNGVGVAKNETTAINWAKQAAEQDNPIGQLILAEMYRQGFGNDVDLKKSAYWYEKALEKRSYALAEYYLAEYYAMSDCEDYDIEKALSLYEKAYEDGYEHAAVDLANLYKKGPSEIRDAQSALYWQRIVDRNYLW